MKQKQLEELMQQSAQDAVTTAKAELDIDLDGSPQSVTKVDALISGLRSKYPEQALEDKAVFTICNICGAYLGEIFLSIAGGRWHYDDTDANAPSIYLQHGSFTFAFAGICFEKLVREPDLSVSDYFEKALQNVE